VNIVKILEEEFKLNPEQATNVISLLSEGATIPFIARYRKERTGSLNEIILREIEKRYEYLKELEQRCQAIISSIDSLGKLTPQLKKRLERCLNKTELEDIYLPYKPRRITRAGKAKNAGLEPLLHEIIQKRNSKLTVETIAKKFLNKKKNILTIADALQGANDILAEDIAERAELRAWLRDKIARNGYICANSTKNHNDDKGKFAMYYDFKERISKLPSHRCLAMFRGEKEKVLRLKLEIENEQALSYLQNRLYQNSQKSFHLFFYNCICDSYKRLLFPAAESIVRKDIKERAEEQAIEVFAKNLQNLLLAPPAGHLSTIGIDPGFRTGCKCAVLTKDGCFVEYKTIFPHPPQKNHIEATDIIREFIYKHKICLIAIGNGTAGRETLQFIKQLLKKEKLEEQVIAVMVNESGASIYSASEIAIAEFPYLDLTVRGAISIGRRLQDPLSELVKCEAKSIGVGQYQHDLNQPMLKKSLMAIVESCVNKVGVDINIASAELLQYVAGLSKILATNIVTYRSENGNFKDRKSILKVKGIGKKSFEQAAGFLRIPNANNPLDNSAVHPESYMIALSMAKQLKVSITQLIGKTELLDGLKPEEFTTNTIGLPTVLDIIQELKKPGRDPRKDFAYAKFNSAICEISDIKLGMILEGTVTNVTNFGAFIDIGVHQDGLVHISQLSNNFVKDPKDIIKIGDVVKTKVIDVDENRARISLTMRNL